jgi:hypothetical protein
VIIAEPPTPTPVVANLAAPLPKLEAPEIDGCPMLLSAVANELGTNSAHIQISFGNSGRVGSDVGTVNSTSGRALTDTSDIQACNSCAKIVEYAAILRDSQGLSMAAMAEVFNQVAPAGAPFTPEMETAIAMAFAENAGNEETPQYAAAMTYIEAFVGYVTVVETELGSPIDNTVEYVLAKYGGNLDAAENENIQAYVQARLIESGF